jgi:hypothetical protein
MSTEDAPYALTLDDLLARSGFAEIMAHHWNRILGSLLLEGSKALLPGVYQNVGLTDLLLAVKPSEDTAVIVATEEESVAVQAAFFALDARWEGAGGDAISHGVILAGTTSMAIGYRIEGNAISVDTARCYESAGFLMIRAAEFLGGEIQVPQEEPVRKCTCDLTELLRFGCRCGGV